MTGAEMTASEMVTVRADDLRWALRFMSSDGMYTNSVRERLLAATTHKGRFVYSGPEYGDVWDCDTDCPLDHADEQEMSGG